MKIKDTLIVLFIVGAMSLVANAIGTKYTIVEAIPGLLFLIFLAIAGVILAKYLPGRIPAVAYIVTLGCILTYPTMPGSDVINEAVKKVGFLQLCTPILAYAGIAIGKDLDAFWKEFDETLELCQKRLADRCCCLCSFYRHLYRQRDYCADYLEGAGTDLISSIFRHWPLASAFSLTTLLNLQR